MNYHIKSIKINYEDLKVKHFFYFFISEKIGIFRAQPRASESVTSFHHYKTNSCFLGNK